MTRATMQVELAERRVILSRDFDFPRELVFRAWTESAAITRWWGPHGLDTEVVENDLRVGGAYHFIMRDADGNAYPVRGRYTVIDSPDRLEMTDDFSCMPPDWLAEHARDELARGEPIENRSVLLLEDLGEGRTRLRLEILCVNNSLRDGLVAAGMNDGWGESFEKLDTWLATA
ncbi:MAG: SRPBCC domain-containing protein [Xanthomonadales bacterium]|nr:SRPBCC domain-containing protein [Xanthomonadales bacterium]